MITARQAYDNYLEWKNVMPIEMFVNSVLKYVITDEIVLQHSYNNTEMGFYLRTMIREIFFHSGCEALPKYTMWRVTGTRLPDELYNKSGHEMVRELKQMYQTSPETSFICKAFKALVYELEVIRGFKVELDLEENMLFVSWNLSSTENAQ